MPQGWAPNERVRLQRPLQQSCAYVNCWPKAIQKSRRRDLHFPGGGSVETYDSASTTPIYSYLSYTANLRAPPKLWMEGYWKGRVEERRSTIHIYARAFRPSDSASDDTDAEAREAYGPPPAP